MPPSTNPSEAFVLFNQPLRGLPEPCAHAHGPGATVSSASPALFAGITLEGLVEGTLTGGPVSNRPSTNPSEGSNSGLGSRRGRPTRASFRGTNGQFWYHFGTRGRGCLKRPGRPKKALLPKEPGPPFEMAFHAEWLRNNPKGPHGPIPPQGRRRRP